MNLFPRTLRRLIVVSSALNSVNSCITLKASALLKAPSSINASNCAPAFAYDIFFIADALGGGFVGAGGVFAGSATSSFLGVLDLVFALGAGAGAASNAASCLGADFGLALTLLSGQILKSFLLSLSS